MGEVIQRWIVEIWDGTGWTRFVPGRWIFEAAVVKAREGAISNGCCTRLVKAV